MIGASFSGFSVLMLYISRLSFNLLFMERFWIMLGGEFLDGGYIQFGIYIASALNFLLIRSRRDILNQQLKAFAYIKDKFFPPGKRYVLLEEDLENLKIGLQSIEFLKNSYTYKIIIRALSKYRTSKSMGEMIEMVSTQIDSYSDKNYAHTSAIRYLNWCIPSLGFIGTIIGLSGALAIAGGSDISAITAVLGVAFDTTLIAMASNIILTLKYTELQRRNDQLFSHTRDFITDNIINCIEEPYEEKRRA